MDIHDITVVNMNAIPIEIRRQGEQSLITRNKMRIDIITEFFVRVVPSVEGVSMAARTLGARTQDPMALKEVIQGRLIDALSAVTAKLTMEEIHTDRGNFIKNGGVCMETQHFPNSPNCDTFPSIVLLKNKKYYTKTSYHFDTF